MARNAGRAKARKGERKDIHANLFLFSYILYVKNILRAYVFAGLELAGQEDIEQNLNASPPAVSRNTGYLPTHHLRHIAHLCVCLCVYLGGFAVDACSLTSPWGF